MRQYSRGIGASCSAAAVWPTREWRRSCGSRPLRTSTLAAASRRPSRPPAASCRISPIAWRSSVRVIARRPTRARSPPAFALPAPTSRAASNCSPPPSAIRVVRRPRRSLVCKASAPRSIARSSPRSCASPTNWRRGRGLRSTSVGTRQPKGSVDLTAAVGSRLAQAPN